LGIFGEFRFVKDGNFGGSFWKTVYSKEQGNSLWISNLKYFMEPMGRKKRDTKFIIRLTGGTLFIPLQFSCNIF
jgi:hypothetical protein